MEGEEFFRLWLRAGLTGCAFAKRLAAKKDRVSIAFYADSEPPPIDWINQLFDEHAKANRAIVLALPRVTNEVRLVELLRSFAADSRWRVKRRRATSPAGDAIIGLEWTTPANEISDAMGFAPFSSMPITRRGPHVAIATWPGSRCNPLRGTPPTPPGRAGQVSFLDASHDFADDEYRDLWVTTSRAVGSLMTVQPDDATLYRRAAFVLPQALAANLVFSDDA